MNLLSLAFLALLPCVFGKGGYAHGGHGGGGGGGGGMVVGIIFAVCLTSCVVGLIMLVFVRYKKSKKEVVQTVEYEYPVAPVFEGYVAPNATPDANCVTGVPVYPPPGNQPVRGVRFDSAPPPGADTEESQAYWSSHPQPTSDPVTAPASAPPPAP